ncbi:MAG: trehalase family glycosidase, partial [Bacteroidales bacterium]
NIRNEKIRSADPVYYPGKLSLTSTFDKGNIKQSLFFIDQYTALWHCSTDIPEALFIQNSSTRSSQIKENTWTLQVPDNGHLQVDFSSDIHLSASANGISALLPAGAKGYAVISYFHKKELSEGSTEKIKEILTNPEYYVNHHQQRWENYLKAVIRPEMEEAYNRVAVKSIVTLLTNWRAQRGDLLHDGVIPSHAAGYFIGFWGWDSWKHAVALASFAPELAKDQMRAMFDYQTPEGMIIDCIYVDKNENNTRDSKPPLAAWALNAIYEKTQDLDFVREMYPALLKYHNWWYQYRDHDQNGICEFGSVDGTLEAAAWESGMDNAIRFDHAYMVKNKANAWSMNQESVDLNAYLIYERNLLQKLTSLIGTDPDLPECHNAVAEYFFSEAKGFFYDRKLPTNRNTLVSDTNQKENSFITIEGCEAYIPFWTKIASPNQMERALKYLSDPAKFSTYIPFPTVTADHPQYTSNGYWRGPNWLDQVYFAIQGIRNYGYEDLADTYTKQVFDRLSGLRENAPIYENYDSKTGAPLRSRHFSWSAAHLLLLYQACNPIPAHKTDLCVFSQSWQNYAYIRNVELGDIRHTAAYEKTNWKDWSGLHLTKLERNKQYTQKTTVSNQNSGTTDNYKVRVWIDWNANYQLEPNELLGTRHISGIGPNGTNHTFEYTFKVPEKSCIDQPVKMRVFLHYVMNETDGEDPCGWVDSGMAYDYGIQVQPDGESGFTTPTAQTRIYPNPVKDHLALESGQPIKMAEVFTANGNLIFSTHQAITGIYTAQWIPGIYILKITYTDQTSSYFKITKQ